MYTRYYNVGFSGLRILANKNMLKYAEKYKEISAALYMLLLYGRYLSYALVTTTLRYILSCRMNWSATQASAFLKRNACNNYIPLFIQTRL